MVWRGEGGGSLIVLLTACTWEVLTRGPFVIRSQSRISSLRHGHNSRVSMYLELQGPRPTLVQSEDHTNRPIHPPPVVRERLALCLWHRACYGCILRSLGKQKEANFWGHARWCASVKSEDGTCRDHHTLGVFSFFSPCRLSPAPKVVQALSSCPDL